ncbi:hypothetical protein [Streptomyces sp. NPDC059491]
MDEFLLQAVKWAGRGVGLAIDYLNLRAGLEHFRPGIRKSRR